ncbi:TetR/AcrR family transcriptional regulator [Noviherbaspirillum aridicola]|uniref:Transcriptional regulator n=1 Tax=Noviherbaspirillum aridicola TaxID=2849687 RepID=A0ABQ4Q4U8_9BURK|nr:TetR/AcrR family transcriptional regulator [Noviherbaspirillum aridicola]GIZ52082.1 transcriptional regulator [Noviherbaspirillum aridicola]
MANDRTEKKSRKQEILDAALACFTEHGIDATTVEMIRERSGASVGSLYHHFGSKESIAAALYVESLAGHHALQKDMLARAKTAEDGIRAAVRAYVDWISGNPEKARFVLYSRSAISKSDAGAALLEHSRAQAGEILQWFQPHIAAGRMKKLPREVYGSLIIGPAHDYARLWLSGRAKTDIKSYRDLFADAAWAAVRPE